MDYPKSVPGVGLVNGKFVDDNPLTGAPGSLIPAEWGNSVTDEVLNVIKAANLVPDENKSDQLKQAITTISRVVGAPTNTYNSISVDQYGHVVNGSLVIPFQDSQQFPAQVYRKNRIINGNFDIWQRGDSGVVNASTGISSGFGPDRWQVFVPQGGVAQWSKTAFALGTGANGGKFSLTVANSSVSGINIRQRIEGVETGAGKTVTVSFHMRSSVAQTCSVIFRQNFGGGTGASSDVDTLSAVSVGTAYQRFSVTMALPSVVGKAKGDTGRDCLELIFVSNIATNHTLELASVQLEMGAVATEYEFRNVGRELEDCLRYFEKSFSPGIQIKAGNGPVTCIANITQVVPAGGSQAAIRIGFRTQKRVYPSIALYSPGNAGSQVWCQTIAAPCTSTAIQSINSDCFAIACYTPSGSMPGYTLQIEWTADAEL